jgi:hypothetical protein
LVAEVQVLGRVDTALDPRVTEPRHGRYHRALVPGTYSFRFIAAGYETLTIAGVNVVADSLTRLDVQLHGLTGLAGSTGAGLPRLIACPNPTRGPVVLHLATGPLDHSTTPLRVYDAAGRLILQSAISNLQSAIVLDLRSLPAGTYLLRAGTASTRLVKVD